jgi:hypothetical protein
MLSLCLGLSLVAAPALAQSPAAASPAPAPAAVTPDDAKPFLGNWTIAGESQMGPFTMMLAVAVDEGKVGAVVSSDMQPATPVSDITKRNDSLVMYYSFDYEGQAIPVVLTVTPKDDKINASFSFADGAFEMGGVGSKTPAAAN